MMENVVMVPARSSKIGYRLHDRLAVASHRSSGVTRAAFRSALAPKNIRSVINRASRYHGCIYEDSIVTVKCKNTALEHRKAVASLDKTGQLATEDVFIQTDASLDHLYDLTRQHHLDIIQLQGRYDGMVKAMHAILDVVEAWQRERSSVSRCTCRKWS